MKQLIRIAVASVLLIAFGTANAVSISMAPASSNVDTGDMVVIEIIVNFDDDPTVGGGIDILFDPSHLMVTNLVQNAVGDPDFTSLGGIDNTNGRVASLAFGDFGCVGGSGDIIVATITFQVIGAFSSTDITMEDNADAAGPFFSCNTFAQQVVDYNGATLFQEDPVCGDSEPAVGEECDDGNTVGGDGCSATCQVEAGSDCTEAVPSMPGMPPIPPVPSMCLVGVCGDSIASDGEACDDGNFADGDGCSSACQVEVGFTCTAATAALDLLFGASPDPSVCTTIPDTDGDGVLDNVDNCILDPNADQMDTDGDGYGNRCDADFNNDCIVTTCPPGGLDGFNDPLCGLGATDMDLMKQVFFSFDPDADLNGDGVVNFQDLGILVSFENLPPGPSGITSTCPIPEPKLTLIKVVENGANPGGTANADAWTLTAAGPTGFSGQSGVMSVVAEGDYDLSESGPVGYTASDWVCDGGTQVDGDTVTFSLRDQATCTITNTAMGMTELLKLTNGVENQTMIWSFTLTGPGVDESDSSPPTTVDFGGVKLIPDEEYTLCETGIPAGWTLEWQVDTDVDGVPDTIIPMVAGVNNDPVDLVTGYSRVYDPNYVPPPGQFTNDTHCVNFVVDVGETLAFQIDNQFPGGEPRTIGFWKNWNTCTNGNQPATAAANGGPDEGWYILDDLLNNPGYTIGDLSLSGADCEDAVNVLDKREITGKKKASDAAYNLAAQLLAAQLNLSGGAETCQAVVDAVNAGQTLLASIGFDGTGRYLRPKDGQVYSDANELAATLDTYNNGSLCHP